MNSFKVLPKLGEGIYSTDEVAEILRLPYHKVKYQMKTFWKNYTFGDHRNKCINFFSLIEFCVFYHLRNEGMTSNKIKKIHKSLSKDFNTPYPFAGLNISSHKTKEGIKKREVWIDFMGHLIHVDGKLQPAIRTFIEPFLNKIEFGNDLLAKRYFPLQGTKNVVVDPLRQFGKPIINGNGVRTDLIYRFYLGGESKKTICNLYDLTESQVEDAIAYHKGVAAA